MLTSTRNPKIKWIRSLQTSPRARQAEGLFVVEGVRLLEEALAAGWHARLLIHSEDLSERGKSVLEGFHKSGAPIELVSPHVMKAASDTQTPQGLLAVLETRKLPLPKPLDFLLIPADVRDPGNLGTILRTALAANVQAVLLPPGVVDPFSPKVVRAGMGAHFRIPILNLSWEQIAANVETLQVYLADSQAGRSHTQTDFNPPLALIVGGEAAGAGLQAQKLADASVHIEMPGEVESLNAAVAAAILMFEVVRQRTRKTKHTS